MTLCKFTPVLCCPLHAKSVVQIICMCEHMFCLQITEELNFTVFHKETKAKRLISFGTTSQISNEMLIPYDTCLAVSLECLRLVKIGVGNTIAFVLRRQCCSGYQILLHVTGAWRYGITYHNRIGSLNILFSLLENKL